MSTPRAVTSTATARARAGVAVGATCRRARRARGRETRAASEDAIDALRELAGDAWSVGRYESKRRSHLTTPLGDIVGEEESRENIAEQPGWNAEGKLRFCVMTVGDELGLTEEEVEERLGNLFALVPGLEERIGEVKIADIVRLAARVPDVATKMIRLRSLLPEADLAKMTSLRPSVLLETDEELGRKVGELRESCPRLRWDAVLSDFPEILGIRDLRGSVLLLKEKLSLEDDESVTKALGGNPLLLLSVQSRQDMISYDNGTWAQVQATISGDKFSDGW